MLTDDDSTSGMPQVRLPVMNIPGGTRWVKVTSPHRSQVIKVRRSTDVAVYYQQEKPGDSQGRNNGQHRSDRSTFLRDYEPYSKRDWVAAQKVLAEVRYEQEHPVTQEEIQATTILTEEIPTPEPEVTVVSETQADLDTWDIPGTLVPEPTPEPVKRRMKAFEIPVAEQDEIIELWRSIEGDVQEGVQEIATTYNTVPPAIWNVLQERVPHEYNLARVVGQLRKENGPLPAYRISQWMHLSKAAVEILCTSEDAQKVLRYYTEVRDPKKPWIATPMLELLPKHVEPEPEPELLVPAALLREAEASVRLDGETHVYIPPTPEEEPVAQKAVATEPTLTVVPPTVQEPARRLRRWKVRLVSVIETEVDAPDLFAAVNTAREQNPQARDVIGATEIE